jgi:hypothetical protein
MFTSRSFGIAVALIVAGTVGLPDTASAQTKRAKPEKKLTYDQAWKKCTPYAQQIPEWNTQGRYARAASCMRSHGHAI